MTVTTESLRQFAGHCVHWAARSKDPISRHFILREAVHWAQIADAIEARIFDRRSEVLPDLRSKLN